MQENMLEIEGLVRHLGGRAVLRDLSLQLGKGEIGCLLGPSGCGKTTALRLIAGFDAPDAGEIRLAGECVAKAGWYQPAEHRQVGVVFQDYALFPHLRVAANIAFGLTGLSARAKEERVAQMLALVGLASVGQRWPHELSGGQQQRVALARALAPRPRLLLLDEPFSNLDVTLREKLSLEVRDILKREGMTAVLVTHDQHEAFAVADRIAVLHDGRVQQYDSPYALYHQPHNPFVADFVGQGVLVPGQVRDAWRVEIELGVLSGVSAAACDGGYCEPGAPGAVDVLLRPDDIIHDDASPQQAVVVRKAFRGADILYTLRLPSGQEVLASVASHHNHDLGEAIGIRLAVDHVVAFRRRVA